MDDKNLFEVMHAAKVFTMEDLEILCSKQFQTRLSYRNFGMLFSQAVQFDVKEVIKTGQEYFKNYHRYILNDKQHFLDITYEGLLAVCNIENNNCNARQLFMVCLDWAKQECKKRDYIDMAKNHRLVLKDILRNTHFPKMGRDDFVDYVVPSDILSEQEIGRIVTGWKKGVKSPWIDQDVSVDKPIKVTVDTICISYK